MSFLRHRPLFYFDMFVFVHMCIHTWVNMPVWKPEEGPSGVPRSHSLPYSLEAESLTAPGAKLAASKTSSPYVYPPLSWGPGVHSPFGHLECLGFELRASRLGSVLFFFPVATTTHPDESDLREKGLIGSVPGHSPPWWGKEASRSSHSHLVHSGGREACMLLSASSSTAQPRVPAREWCCPVN